MFAITTQFVRAVRAVILVRLLLDSYTIAKVPATSSGMMTDVPAKPVIIKSAVVLARSGDTK